eukprot:m.98897 g.98897  ORF g.98897 m.98897 type:complete len:207 (-) comp9024_c1_seq2:1812-2432(-)
MSEKKKMNVVVADAQADADAVVHEDAAVDVVADADVDADVDDGEAPQPIEVDYCENCTLPLEYCEFSGQTKKCYTVLKENNPELFKELYGDVSVDDVTVQKQKKPRGGKAGKAAKQKAASDRHITVTRTKRGKKKFSTIVAGIKSFDLDLKKTSKAISSKFAASSSIVGEDEVQVTGDITYDIVDFLTSKFKEITEDDITIVLKDK